MMVLVKYHVDVLKIKYRYKNTYKYKNYNTGTVFSSTKIPVLNYMY